MIGKPGVIDFPVPFPPDRRVIAVDELSVGQRFGPLYYRLTPSAVAAYLDALRAPGAAPKTVHAGDEAPIALTGVVGLVKLALGGAWPENTVHVRQRLEVVDAPVRVGDPLSLEVWIESLDRQSKRDRVVLATSTRRQEGSLLVRSWMTVYWGGMKR